METAPTPDPDEVERLVTTLTNWGRFGPDDERGTLNLITPDVRVAATRLVASGRTCSLARQLRPRVEVDNPEPMLHFMRRSGEAASPDGFSSAADWIGLNFHGFATTHLDALCHVIWKGRMYNGVDARAVTTERRALRLSVESMGGPIVGRGVLLDAPRALDVPWIEPGVGLDVDDLDRCVAAAGVEIRPGDTVLLRTGRDVRRAAQGAHNPIVGGLPGLLSTCLPWIRERDIAVLGCDGVSDVMAPGGSPHLMPVHAVALVAMGMPLLDNALLEGLAAACIEEGRWEFLLTLAPLPLQGGTGSPVTPVAVF